MDRFESLLGDDSKCQSMHPRVCENSKIKKGKSCL